MIEATRVAARIVSSADAPAGLYCPAGLRGHGFGIAPGGLRPH